MFTYKKFSSLTLFALLILMSGHCSAQQETKPGSFGFHLGVNSGILDNAIGPSFSLHYAFNIGKVLQPESMLFFDSHSGKEFISGNQMKATALGLAAGLRVNISPHTNWNPSLVFMPGIAFGSESSRFGEYRNSGITGALSLGFSNAIYKRHMATIGLNIVEDMVFAAFVKYGLWL